MDFILYTIFVIYSLSSLGIGIYCLFQFNLFLQYISKKKKNKEEEKSNNLPGITIQLPIFNEKNVVERLLKSVETLNYPKEKLQIQLLDDSTDDTILISKKLVSHMKGNGWDISHIHRTERKGYKAGALKEAMHQAAYDYIAIFDADFIIPSNFLINNLPFIQKNNVALVQNRWGHLNQYQNILTELQTLQLNTHFTVEQRGRYEAGYPCQFNGTAGIWKKEAIIDGGNWEADTLTEDLDLSYRVQLKGWKIIFLDDHVAPAELPSSVNALKSQQFRWMKGGAETAKKLIPQIFLSNWNFINKLQSFFHLLGSSVYLLIFLMGLTSVPLLILGKAKTNLFLFENWFYLISFYFIFIIYFYSNVFLAWSEKSLIYKAIKFALLFPIFLSLSMGLALHNTVAVIQGWVGKKSSFVRTPKTGQNNSINYDVYKLGWITIGEGLLFLYYFAAMIFSLATKDHRFLYFHFLTSFGFGTIFILTLIGLKKHKHAN